MHENSGEEKAPSKVSEKHYIGGSDNSVGDDKASLPMIQFTGRLHHGIAPFSVAMGNICPPAYISIQQPQVVDSHTIMLLVSSSCPCSTILR